MAPTLALGAPAPATTPTPAGDIVVEAQRDKALHDFISTMTNVDTFHQIARWSQEVCPNVVGVPPAQAHVLEARIGAVATAVHLAVGQKDSCVTSLLVVIDQDASWVTHTLARAFPASVRGERDFDLSGFEKSTRPVRWISVINPCGFAGCPSPELRQRLVDSRLRTNEKPAFQASVIVVDGQQLAGVRLGELGDYLAFVALANPPQHKTWPATSIMALFNTPGPTATPLTLSRDDMAFLRSLYHTPPDATGVMQRSAILANMKKPDRHSEAPSGAPNGQ